MKGVFHYAKNSGNLGHKSNRKVVSARSHQNIRTGGTESCLSILTNRFVALLFFSRSDLCREFGKGIGNGKRHSSWLTRR